VFEGTVQQAKGAPVPGMPGAGAAVVRVDRIVQGPQGLRAFEGRDVLVVPGKGERMRPGERAVFYTNGASLGETLAVASIGHLPQRMAAATRALARPSAALERRDLRDRIDAADMVVVGRVSSVRVPSEAPGPRARAAGLAAAPPRRISEHDPEWREAVIAVDRVEMGERRRKQVVVKFPASTDVRWFKAPKFTPGQEGVFILHRPPGAIPAAARARATPAAAPDAYVALHPADVQPAEREDEITALVEGSGTAAPRQSARRAKRSSAHPAKASASRSPTAPARGRKTSAARSRRSRS
jgi:hypothetical protein